MGIIRTLTSRLLAQTPLQYYPVTVQKGLAKGARWTLFPYSAYWRGNTELDVEEAIRLHGSIRGATCWDLGTHFGIYTVGMAMAVGSQGQVIGFEPNPLSFKRCQYHVNLNSLSWVKLFNAAVSASEGSSTLIISNNNDNVAPSAHFAYEDEQVDAKTPSLKVNTLVLDNLVVDRLILSR